MARYVFTDFDQLADSTNGIRGRYIPTAPSQTAWWIDVRRVARVHVQHVQVGAPCVFSGYGESDQLTIGLPLSDPHAITIDGEHMGEDSFVLIRPGHPFTGSAPEATRWVSICIPTQAFGDSATDWPIGGTSGQITESHLQATRSPTLRRLRLLLAWLTHEHRLPEEDHAPYGAVEMELLGIARDLIRIATPRERNDVGRPRIARSRIVAECLALLHANESQPIQIGDLCQAANVSERTLRNVFLEYFGVGPTRFLRARQLNEIRRHLLKPRAPDDTVTSVAARFGVYDFSLLARHYRAMYGEAPSRTLRTAKTRVYGSRPRRRDGLAVDLPSAKA